MHQDINLILLVQHLGLQVKKIMYLIKMIQYIPVEDLRVQVEIVRC
jgi:hypothetical protein